MHICCWQSSITERSHYQYEMDWVNSPSVFTEESLLPIPILLFSFNTTGRKFFFLHVFFLNVYGN